MTRMAHRWKTLAAVAAFTGLVGFGTFVAAQTPGGAPPPGGGAPPAGAHAWGPRHWGPPRGRMMMMGGLPGLWRMDLTTAQRQQIGALVRQYMKTWQPQLLPLRLALQQAIELSPVDPGTIQARSADLAAVESQAAVARAQLRAQILTLLTPAQQQRVARFEARMNQRMQRMLQRLSGQPGGGR
ncbi:MAG TPA: hypothetical protein VNE16_07305 [Vicinamibacterales bacterium]|nr:hypothetical protein [Vicinamibacterales bacterium]